MICLSISGLAANQILEELQHVSIAEIRLDLLNLSDAEIKKIFESHSNLIVTYRPGQVDESERTRQLKLALECGAAWIDIEFEATADWKNEMLSFAKKLGKRTIISSHNFEETPSKEALNALITNMQNEGTDLVKLACQANSQDDCARLLSLYERYKNILVIGMGSLGTITRIAAPFLGAPFTFAAGKAGKTAPGQLTFSEMQQAIQLISHGE